MKLRPLPVEVEKLLGEAHAPRRLVAHLRLVHDVACEIVKTLASEWPKFQFDAGAVVFGAATHDIGKALHPSELTEQGSAHELAGHALLVEKGVPEARARFARTHAQWNAADATVEDLLVSLADKVWKGRREESLEQMIVGRIAAATGQKPWDVFMKLDDVLGAVALDAEARLEFQGQGP